MDSEGAQRLAAEVLSRILSDNAIRHAFIGGFALRMLEHDRKTDDIDVEVDILPGEQPREHLIQLILGADSRFSVKALGKLFFTPLENPDLSVPVETLPVGTLNLPTSLLTVSPGDGALASFLTPSSFHAPPPPPVMHVLIMYAD